MQQDVAGQGPGQNTLTAAFEKTGDPNGFHGAIDLLDDLVIEIATEMESLKNGLFDSLMKFPLSPNN